MRERVAQMVLLVRAFEEVDRDGVVLSSDQRLAASRRAVMVTTRDEGEGRFSRRGTIRNEETVVRRARLLFNTLSRRVPSLQRVLAMSRLRSLMGPTVMLFAFAVGLATNLPLEGREIHLLAVPLIGLLGWNLVSYGLMGLLKLARARAAGSRAAADPTGRSQDRLVTGLASSVVRFALWRSRLGGRKAGGGSQTEQRVAARAFVRFLALWHRLTGDLLEARVRRRLHLGAMAMALGVLAGMYWRAVAFEYRATWESTLLDAGQMQFLLDTLLAPASWISGIDVPAVAPLEAPRDGDAAPWLHLWAATTGLVVLAPRALLALLAGLRSLRLGANLPVDLDEPYFRRSLADWRGTARRVLIVPYSYAPPPATLEPLKTLLFDFFGTRAELNVRRSLDYGDEGLDLVEFAADHGQDGDETAESYLVLLFNLAQSPETEVHGALIERLKTALDAEHGRLLAVVDATGYTQHAGAARGAERLALWKQVVGQSGLELAELDPRLLDRDPAVADARMALLRGALWPAGDVVTS